MVRHLLAVVPLLVAGDNLRADLIVDQSHVLDRYMSGMGAGFIIDQETAQTIQVGIAGQLERLDFWATQNGDPAPGDLVLDIRYVSLDGVPDDSVSLAQVTIPRADIETLVGPSIPSSVDQFRLSVDLAPFNLHFEEGDIFAIHFTNSDPSGGGATGTTISILGDLSPGTGPYPSGQAFIRNNQQNGGEFFAWETPDEQVDLGFVTYVTPTAAVPESATMNACVLLGVSGVVCLRRSR